MTHRITSWLVSALVLTVLSACRAPEVSPEAPPRDTAPTEVSPHLASEVAQALVTGATAVRQPWTVCAAPKHIEHQCLLCEGSLRCQDPNRLPVGLDVPIKDAYVDSVGCALDLDQRLWCWAEPDESDGEDQQQNITVTADRVARRVEHLERVEVFGASPSHVCAAHGSELVCWGSNDWGQLGSDDPSATHVVHHLEHTVDGIVVTDTTSCMRLGRTLRCFGPLPPNVEDTSFVSEPSELVFEDTIVQVTLIDVDQRCVVLANGQVWCWGDNRMQNLVPHVADEVVLEPTRIESLPPAAELFSMYYYVTCVRTLDDELYCWGDSLELGFGLDSGFLTNATWPGRPLAIMSNVNDIRIRETERCVRDANQRQICWGYDTALKPYLAMPFDVEALYEALETRAPLTDVTALALGRSHTCALDRSGKAWCWGLNTNGELGDGTFVGATPVARPVLALDDGIDICAGDAHNCALTASGDVRCWGYNGRGQLGVLLSDTNTSFAARVPLPEPAVQLACGGEHNCARLQSGRVACWGRNYETQLGNGRQNNPDELIDPELPQPIGVPAEITLMRGIRDAIDIAASDVHTCVLRKSSRVVCYGGFSIPLEHVVPLWKTPRLEGIHRIRMGLEGNLWLFFENGTADALHLPNTTSEPLPFEPLQPTELPVPPERFGPGAGVNCMVLDDGRVQCRGPFIHDMMGTGIDYGMRAPGKYEPANHIDDAVAVAVSTYTVCAIVGNGQVRCWGDNYFGKAGADVGDSTAHLLEPGPPVQRIDAEWPVRPPHDWPDLEMKRPHRDSRRLKPRP